MLNLDLLIQHNVDTSGYAKPGPTTDKQSYCKNKEDSN